MTELIVFYALLRYLSFWDSRTAFIVIASSRARNTEREFSL